jgi:leucine dehydrogenase
LGSVLNEVSIPQLRVRIVAGAANDPLADEGRDPLLLEKHGILYAPDFVINAGGLIHVAQEWTGYEEAQARSKTEEIGPTLREVFQMAEQDKITPHAAALLLAQSRLQ